MQLAVTFPYGTVLVVPQEYVGAMTEILVNSLITNTEYNTGRELDYKVVGMVPEIILIHDNQIVEAEPVTEPTAPDFPEEVL